jgi:arylsulfatase A-like enzyme
MRDNTLILFSTDNGSATSALFATGARSEEERKESGGVGLGEKPPASNGVLRGGKGTLHEGGVRVAAFANGPGLKPRTVNEPLHMVDIMPTLFALSGGRGSSDHAMDGKDIWPPLADGKPTPHEDILINVEAFRGAIRKGDWKLAKIALLPGRTELFDLAKDPGETTNVAEQHPGVAVGPRGVRPGAPPPRSPLKLHPRSDCRRPRPRQRC